MFGKGFSLIELMVVIAIVAILAAVAVPAYKTYLVRTRIASVLPTFDQMTDKMVAYSQTHGIFPTAEQLNEFPATGIVANDPAAINKYLIYLDMYDVSGCGKHGNLRMDLNPSLIGLDDADRVILASAIFQIDGVFVKVQHYLIHHASPAYYVVGNEYLPASAWTNTRQDEAGSTANFDATIAAYLANATCL